MLAVNCWSNSTHFETQTASVSHSSYFYHMNLKQSTFICCSKIYANEYYKEFLVPSAFLTDPTLHIISLVKDCLNLTLNVV